MAEVHYGRWGDMFLVPCSAPDLGHTEVIEPQLWLESHWYVLGTKDRVPSLEDLTLRSDILQNLTSASCEHRELSREAESWG